MMAEFDMEAAIRRAEDISLPTDDKPGWEWSDSDKLACYERAIKAVGGARVLAWGTMIYACSGAATRSRLASSVERPKGCGWEHRVWLCLGVEGPQPLKEAHATVPCPFYCGRCPECKSPLAHDRWNEDETFGGLKDVLADTAYFSLPSVAQARKNVKIGYGGADYVDPTGKTNASRAERRRG